MVTEGKGGWTTSGCGGTIASVNTSTTHPSHLETLNWTTPRYICEIEHNSSHLGPFVESSEAEVAAGVE